MREDDQFNISIRRKAEQDLQAVQAKIAETNTRLAEYRAEERDLVGFLKRLDRYTPEEKPDILTMTGSSHRPASGALPLCEPPALNRTLSAVLAAGQQATKVVNAATPYLSLGGKANHNGFHIYSDAVGLEWAGADAVPKSDTRRGRVNNAVFSLMAGSLTPRSIKSMVELLRTDAELYSFLGTRPEATLSSYLSRDPRFAFDRTQGGWVLTNTPSGGEADQDSQSAGSVDQEGGRTP